MNKIVSLSQQEIETIKAALAYWQEWRGVSGAKKWETVSGFFPENSPFQPLSKEESELLCSRLEDENHPPHIAVTVEGGVVLNVLVMGELDQVPVTVIDYDNQGEGSIKIPLFDDDEEDTEWASANTFYPEKNNSWLRKALATIEKQREEGIE
jgi:hypothetical protein